MSGYVGDLSSFQQKSLEELQDMLTAETTADEVNKKRGNCQGDRTCIRKMQALTFHLIRE